MNFSGFVEAICELGQLNHKLLSEKLAKILPSEHKGTSTSSSSRPKSSSLGKSSASGSSELIKVSGRRAKREELVRVPGRKTEHPSAIASTLSPEDREQKYAQFLSKLKDVPEGIGGFSKDHIKDFNRKNRVNERSEEMQDLDEKKKDFVNALYGHLKSS